jgi:hypothetical protein
MDRRSRLAVVRFALGLNLFLVSAWPSAVRAELLFSRPSIQVGDVRCGTALVQPFEFTNHGPDAVEIVQLRPSCGCLTPRLAQSRYQAGEHGTLQVEINTLSQAAGPHRWPVRVFYRSGGQDHETTLEVVGRVITEISVEPSSLALIATSNLEREIVLTDSRPKKLRVTGVVTTSELLAADLVDRSVDQATTRIRLQARAVQAEGRHEEAILIRTDDPDYRELRISVTLIGESQGRLRAAPNPVTWTLNKGEPIPARVVLVRDQEEQQVLVESVEADDPAIQCRWAQGPNQNATVRITLDPARLVGPVLRSAIHIHVKGPVKETLSIPVEYSVE